MEYQKKQKKHFKNSANGNTIYYVKVNSPKQARYTYWIVIVIASTLIGSMKIFRRIFVYIY